jgi:virginiamycin A acetyltransferase
MGTHTLTDFLYRLYRIDNHRVRNLVRLCVRKLEGGDFYSETLRRIFREYHNVDIGMYTHGGCFEPFHVDPCTTIGRYCSIAPTARMINRDHPVGFKSSHGFFYVSVLGFCESDLVDYIPLEVGNDVWVGHNAVILPHAKKIGDGAVIAAGAVVNKDVPPYGIVVGNPARVVRYRFSRKVIDELLASRWWEKSIEEIKPGLHEFQRPYEVLALGNQPLETEV